jgi:predicted HTH domain antitoxin
MRILSGVGTREYNKGLRAAISADKHDSREWKRAAACQEQIGDWRQINWPSEIAFGFLGGEKPSMNISFEIPLDIEQELRGNGTDISGEARVAFLIELYRQERITHHQLAEALGLSRLETDGVLKRHKVSSGPTLEELRAEIGSLRNVTPE